MSAAAGAAPAAEILAARIRREGPILFSEFMETALYHPEAGYYSAAGRAARDPFGAGGDFFTASQIQPVFGRLIAASLSDLARRLALPPSCAVADWGAGRAELAAFLSGFRYLAIDVHSAPPEPFEGLIFANELFDALPVDAAQFCGGELRMRRVAWDGAGFAWRAAEPVEGAWRDYALRVGSAFQEMPDWRIELPVRMAPLVARMSAALARGAVLIIDYGYTDREAVRFPRGTLMSYRRHRAVEDVLQEPGGQDITAHVPFSHLEACAAEAGFRAGRLENLSSFLLRAGERDHFAAALDAAGPQAGERLRLQLKTLLFGMGETFRCLVLDK